MDLDRYIPLHLVFWLIIGIIVAYVFPTTLGPSLCLLLFSLLLLISLQIGKLKHRITRWSFTLILSLVFMSVGYVRTCLSDPRIDPQHYSHHTLHDNIITLRITAENKPTQNYLSYIGQVDSLNGRAVKGKIHVNIATDTLSPQDWLGKTLCVQTNLHGISAPLNPFQFNYQDFLSRKGIFHQLFIFPQHIVKSGSSERFSFSATSVRKKILKKLAGNGFKGDELGMINALLLGQRNALSKTLIENYQNAGAIHILAVSGLHVGIILLLLQLVLAPLQQLPYGNTLKIIFQLLGLWLFAALAGFSPSVIRATTMFTAVAIGMSKQDRITTVQALLISLFILLLINPNYLLEVGFQLSYTAVFFILWVQPKIVNLWKPKLKITSYFWQLSSVSLAAQIGVLPLSIFYFHQFPGLFILSNLLIIPFLASLLIVGLIICLLAVMNILPTQVVDLYSRLIQILNSGVGWIAEQRVFLIEHISLNIPGLILGYLSLIFLFYWWEQRRPFYFRLLLLAFLGFQVNVLLQKQRRTPTRWIVFNTARESLMAFRQGNQLQAFGSHPQSSRSMRSLEALSIGVYSTPQAIDSLQNAYTFHGKSIYVIDDRTRFLPAHVQADILYLRQSPPVNLARMLVANKPQYVIADASNYKSDIGLWEKTCENYNIKFHYTVRDGAFLLQL